MSGGIPKAFRKIYDTEVLVRAPPPSCDSPLDYVIDVFELGLCSSALNLSSFCLVRVLRSFIRSQRRNGRTCRVIDVAIHRDLVLMVRVHERATASAGHVDVHTDAHRGVASGLSSEVAGLCACLGL